MAYPATSAFNPKLVNDQAGFQQILNVSATQAHPLGLTVMAQDYGSNAYGAAWYVYVKGVASVAQGDFVTFDPSTTLATTRLTTTAGIGPVGVAMSAIVASNYGWVAVSGVVPANIAAGGAGSLVVYATTTAGQGSETVTANKGLHGAITLAAASGGFAPVLLDGAFFTGKFG